MKLITLANTPPDTIADTIADTQWYNSALMGFDLETTGVNPETARIVTATLILSNPAERKCWVKNWLVNPGIPIPAEASAVHGVTDAEAQARGMEPAQAVAEIVAALDWIRDAYGAVPLCIFNAPYDLTVLDHEIGRHAPQLTGWLARANLSVIDPLVIDRASDRYRRGSRKLAAICGHYGVALTDAHTSQGDTLATVALARTLGSRYGLNMRAQNLHNSQRLWFREWAQDFQRYKRRTQPDIVISDVWPYAPTATEVT